MMKLLWGTLLLALAFVCPQPSMAKLEVDVSISLPPPIVFHEPPMLIVLPETYVYVVPDAEVDIFFYDGWWWRPWEGRWYRSRDYSSGWGYYQEVPSFYREIPATWRDDYRAQRWRGQQWDIQRIPQQQVQQNWSGWQKNKHWEKQQTWGVQSLQLKKQSQQPAQEMQPRQSQPQHKEAKPQHPRKQEKQEKQEKSHNQGKGKD
jgi:hypothetical protein